MRKKHLAAAVAFSLATGNALAGSRCAGPEDELAMKTSSMQQALMVAALSCGDAPLYNRFVLSYRTELQRADAALLAFFVRRNTSAGERDYHAFKTKAANVSALQSARDSSGYCANAQRLFSAALDSGPVRLADFVLTQWQGTNEIIRARCTADADEPAASPEHYDPQAASPPAEPTMGGESQE